MARGWCGTHYMQWLRGRVPHLRLTVEERFWSKVDRQGPDECWPWIDQLDSKGYGRFKLNGHYPVASRVAWELTVGPIPEGLKLDHLCRNPPCVNPAHLEPVPQKENVRRGLMGVLRTHCPNDHEYVESTTKIDRKGHRVCRICERERMQRFLERRRAM